MKFSTIAIASAVAATASAQYANTTTVAEDVYVTVDCSTTSGVISATIAIEAAVESSSTTPAAPVTSEWTVSPVVVSAVTYYTTILEEVYVTAAAVHSVAPFDNTTVSNNTVVPATSLPVGAASINAISISIMGAAVAGAAALLL